VPLNSLALITVISFAVSLIYIGSTTAYDAIISLTSIGTHISYVLPILFIMLRKIRGPPLVYGPFSLGKWGVPVNMFALLYLIFVIIWMPFPTEIPVTASNMNYAGPILLVIILAGIADWIISGHKRFEFPVARYIPEN
jgi:choline transport protein